MFFVCFSKYRIVSSELDYQTLKTKHNSAWNISCDFDFMRMGDSTLSKSPFSAPLSRKVGVVSKNRFIQIIPITSIFTYNNKILEQCYIVFIYLFIYFCSFKYRIVSSELDYETLKAKHSSAWNNSYDFDCMRMGDWSLSKSPLFCSSE